MLAFISFLGRKNDEKILSQISKSEYIEIKAHGKKQNELLHNTSRFLEMELWWFKVHVRTDILCTAHGQRAFFNFRSVVSYDSCVVWGQERYNFSQF